MSNYLVTGTNPDDPSEYDDEEDDRCLYEYDDEGDSHLGDEDDDSYDGDNW